MRYDQLLVVLTFWVRKMNKILERIKKNVDLKNILIIVIVYFIAHWFLLMVSGYWWDDAVLIHKKHEEMAEFYSQNGAVLGGLFTYSVIWLPAGGYRVCVFTEFLLSSIFVYYVLKDSELLSDNECFWISLIFSVVPVNDARTLISCYGYSCTFFLFWLAFFLVTKWYKKTGIMHWVIRCFTWPILFTAFSTESVIAFCGLIILYLYYKDYKNVVKDFSSFGKFVRGIPVVVIRNIDYIIVPMVYWFVKSMFFKPWGPYENKNVFTLKTLLSTILHLPSSMYGTTWSVIDNYLGQISILSLIIADVCIAVFIFGFIKNKRWKKIEDRPYYKSFIGLGIGILSYATGIFPYSVVRGGGSIAVNGRGGRDSLLLALGISLCIYYLVELIIHPYVRSICFVVVIVLGIFHFNYSYMQYQQEWYEELELENKISSTKDILDNNTFLVLFTSDKPGGSGSFYCMNINSFDVTGEQTRAFWQNLSYVTGEAWQDYFLHGYGMDDYDTSDTGLDGVLLFDNKALSKKDILRLKFKEIFLYDEFISEINARDRIEYINCDENNRGILYELNDQGRVNYSTLNEALVR